MRKRPTLHKLHQCEPVEACKFPLTAPIAPLQHVSVITLTDLSNLNAPFLTEGPPFPLLLGLPLFPLPPQSRTF